MPKTLLRTDTFEYQDGKITVQCETILSIVNHADLLKRLTEHVLIGTDYLNGFVSVITQTVAFEGFDFSLPSPDAALEDLLTAFEWYIRLPSDLIRMWIAAITRVNQAPNSDPDLQPAEVSSKDPKSKRSERERSEK